MILHTSTFYSNFKTQNPTSFQTWGVSNQSITPSYKVEWFRNLIFDVVFTFISRFAVEIYNEHET